MTSSAPPIDRYFGQGYYALYRRWLLPGEQTAAEVDFLLRRLRPRAGQRWLDLPCGYGRHLLELRRRRPGLGLAGGDLNRAYLGEPGLREAAAVAACDMRRLPFAAATFHVALDLLNSFGYYPADDATILVELARVLRPGGTLVLDLPNRRALIDLVRQQPLIRYCGGEYEVTEAFEWDPASQTLRNQTDWRWAAGHESAGYHLRLYTPAQIRRLLGAAGFTVREVFGDFTGADFDPWQSDRMLIFAEKSNDSSSSR